MALHFHPLKIRSVRPDTDEAVIVSFDVPAELSEAFRFTQGQHLTLRETLGGNEERNSCASASGTSKETITASSVSATTLFTRSGWKCRLIRGA